MIGFGSNISALVATRMLAAADSNKSIALEHLSSGMRINRPSDDAAGQAIASSLNTRARVYSQALRNANDGISALSIADGTLSQLSDLTIRLKELANQSANGVFSRTQRLSLDNEAYALTNEFNRLVGSTKFNGLSLLDGSLRSLGIQLGFGSDEQITSSISNNLQRSIGSGTFGSNVATTLPSGTATASISDVADFNGDGKQDMVVCVPDAVAGPTINVLLSQGNGTSFAVTSYIVPGGISASAVKVGDFNGDGRMDFVGSNSSGGGGMAVYLGDGNGTFNMSTSNNVRALDMVVADVNGDGKQDIIASYNTSNGTMQTFFGNGDGTFIAGSAGVTAMGSRITAGDFNGDGYLDIAGSGTAGGNAYKIALGNATGTYSTGISYSIGFTPAGLAAADYNHDGLTDLALLSSVNSTVSVYLASGSGTFSLSASYATPSSAATLFTADYNNDGIPDLYTGNSTTTNILLGQTDGTFSSYATTTLNATLRAVGDFNGDGVVDIAGGSTNNVISSLSGTNSTSNVQRLNLTTQVEARNSLSIIDAILNRITLERSAIGAAQSRIGTAISHLSQTVEGYRTAESRITDIDVAQEVAELTRTDILRQTAAAVLAQANLIPSIALSLIRE